MLRRSMSSVIPSSLSLLRTEQLKNNSISDAGRGDSNTMASVTQALMAVKKVDKKVPVIQQSFMIGSLLEQLCSLYETDKAKSKKLYFAICEQLSKWGILSPVAYLEEYASIHTQYRNALYNVIQSSLLNLDGSSAILPSMLGPGGENSSIDSIIVDRHKVFDFETSRYHREFDEIGKLGSGGYGSVFRARSKIDGQEYALKKIPLPHSLVSAQNANLLREVRVLSGLRHKNIVQYHSAWIEQTDSTAASSLEDKEDSSLDSDCFIPITSRKLLPHVDSLLLESSDEDISFSSRKSGSFGYFERTSESLSSVSNLNVKSRSSKFWDESSASEASASTAHLGGNIHFTISPEHSDEELLFEEPDTTSLCTDQQNDSSSPPKEIIYTHGVRRDMAMLNRVQSFRFPKETSSYRSVLESTRNHSFSVSGERDFQKGDMNVEGVKHSSKLMKFAQSPFTGSNLVLYMQMQLCQTSLKHWLSSRNRSISSGRKLFRESISLVIMKQITAALFFLHSRNLIHRDVKPPNIFLDNVDAEHPHVLLGDFGLAKNGFLQSSEPYSPANAMGLRRLGSHTSGVGTMTYAAPEQLLAEAYDTKVDMYSFGIVLYELWNPFSTSMEKARELKRLRRQDIPKDFLIKYSDIGKIITSLLNHNPKLRLSSSDLYHSDIFEKSKDRIIEDQLQRISSLEREVKELKLINKKLQSKLEVSQVLFSD